MRVLMCFLCVVFVLSGPPARAQATGEAVSGGAEGAPPPPPARRGGDEPCLLMSATKTALRTAEHGLTLMRDLEKMIDDRVSASRDAFRSCEQDEGCRTSPRLREREDAFNQAHEQKRRMAALHAESTRRKAELEERLKAFDLQAMASHCPGGESP